MVPLLVAYQATDSDVVAQLHPMGGLQEHDPLSDSPAQRPLQADRKRFDHLDLQVEFAGRRNDFQSQKAAVACVPTSSAKKRSAAALVTRATACSRHIPSCFLLWIGLQAEAYPSTMNQAWILSPVATSVFLYYTVVNDNMYFIAIYDKSQ